MSLHLKGHKLNLPFYARSNDPAKIKSGQGFFTDALTGKGAYGAGRYINIDLPGTPHMTSCGFQHRLQSRLRPFALLDMPADGSVF